MKRLEKTALNIPGSVAKTPGIFRKLFTGGISTVVVTAWMIPAGVIRGSYNLLRGGWWLAKKGGSLLATIGKEIGGVASKVRNWAVSGKQNWDRYFQITSKKQMAKDFVGKYLRNVIAQFVVIGLLTTLVGVLHRTLEIVEGKQIIDEDGNQKAATLGNYVFDRDKMSRDFAIGFLVGGFLGIITAGSWFKNIARKFNPDNLSFLELVAAPFQAVGRFFGSLKKLSQGKFSAKGFKQWFAAFQESHGMLRTAKNLAEFNLFFGDLFTLLPAYNPETRKIEWNPHILSWEERKAGTRSGLLFGFFFAKIFPYGRPGGSPVDQALRGVWRGVSYPVRGIFKKIFKTFGNLKGKFSKVPEAGIPKPNRFLQGVQNRLQALFGISKFHFAGLIGAMVGWWIGSSLGKTAEEKERLAAEGAELGQTHAFLLVGVQRLGSRRIRFIQSILEGTSPISKKRQTEIVKAIEEFGRSPGKPNDRLNKRFGNTFEKVFKLGRKINITRERSQTIQ